MIQSHPFPIFEAPGLRRSIETLRSVGGANANEDLPAIHKQIIAPLCEAMAQGPAEKLSTGRRANDTVYAIAAGEHLFPIVHARASRTTETWVFPPVARDRVTPDRLREASSTFGEASSQRHPSWKQEEIRTGALEKWLDVFYGGRQPMPLTVHVKDGDAALMRGTDLLDEGNVAKETASVVDLLLRTARQPQTVVEKSLFGSLFSFGSSGARSQGLSAELRSLCTTRSKATELAGPPAGLADDLCSVAVWRDRIVVLTSQRGEGGRTRLWIEDSVGGRACFREIPTPELPPNGVTMTVVDDEVRLYGGAYRDGTTSPEVFVYSLSSASSSGFGPEHWRNGPTMAKPAAWAVVARVDREIYVTDGVSKLAQDKQGDSLRMPVHQRAFRKLQNMKWIERSGPPTDTTGASVASDRRVFVVGPGNARDGKLYLCDTVQGEKWYTLPSLPKAVGVGQVFLSEEKITYVGGFGADGKPSFDIYQLDLNSLSGRWEHVGSSPYVGGLARIVQRKGQLAAVMVTPTHSRVYQISL